VARAWTAAWAVLNDVELPAELPPAFDRDRQRYDFRAPTLWDPSMETPEEVRRGTRAFAERQVDAIQRLIFPVHGL